MSPIKKTPTPKKKAKRESSDLSDKQITAIRKIMKIGREDDLVIIFKIHNNGQQVVLHNTSNFWVVAASMSLMRALRDS